MEDTITLKELRALIKKIRRIEYGTQVTIKNGFTANSEQIYYCLQKEVYAQSQFSLS